MYWFVLREDAPLAFKRKSELFYACFAMRGWLKAGFLKELNNFVITVL